MFAVFIYIAAIVAANLSVAAFGPAITPINAFFLIGLDLSLRDVLHQRWQNQGLALKMGALLAVAGAVSYALNPASGRIALASVLAFTVSNAVDALAFHLLRRQPYLTRANGSNAFGALTDSLLFPTLAFGALLPGVVAAQFAAKFFGGAVWSLLFRRFRAV